LKTQKSYQQQHGKQHSNQTNPAKNQDSGRLFWEKANQKANLAQHWQNGKGMKHRNRIDRNLLQNFSLYLKQKSLISSSPFQITEKRRNKQKEVKDAIFHEEKTIKKKLKEEGFGFHF
jgi:hypothetical protein